MAHSNLDFRHPQVALSTCSVILDNIKEESADEYLRMNE
jgi:hypothetical protein